ncbi:MAG: phosphorylase [Cyanobacteria bacterium P01_A01_bin.116]
MPLAVILTALPVEYMAVRSYLTNLKEETHPQGTIYERGTFVDGEQEWDVGIAEVGAGNASSAVEAERSIAYFKPNIIFFVGIAGGIKDVKIGDVVAATKVYGYESSKAGEKGFSVRPTAGQSTYAVVQRAKSEARKSEWLKRLTSNSNPRVLVAPIAAGEKVVASTDSALFRFLRNSYNDAIAVEMEGYGFLNAAFAYPNIKTMVIRGISDLIKDKNADDLVEGNEEKRQERASQNASAFAFEVLAKIESGNTASETERQKDKPAKSDTPNFFAYDDDWVGRDELIASLNDRIRGNCRLLMLVGITGIGKTALGERLAVEVADWFEENWSHYHQENFDDEHKNPDFVSVAAGWLEKWGEPVTPDDRKDPQRILNRTVSFLQENRYLVQMDSVENILEGNEEKGWSNFKDEWWLKFFESYLKADSCASHILLTSQDLPGELEEEGSRSQNFWHIQLLRGLDKVERVSLFKKIGLDVTPQSKSLEYLERIGEAYDGHPLALRVILGEIKHDPFNKNVIAYWNKYKSEVEEVEKALEKAKQGMSVGGDDKWKLHEYTKALRRNVKSRLDKAFSRLREEVKWSYILLCESSVYRCSVPEGFWLSHLEDWDKDNSEQRAALDMLKERYLVEESVENDQVHVKQHNLVRSVSLEHLKKLDDFV